MIRWEEEAIVLSSRPYGETGLVAHFFCRHRGKIASFVRGGQSRKKRPLYQMGRFVRLRFEARLENHLGSCEAENLESLSSFILQDPLKLWAFRSLCEALDAVLPQAHSYEHLYMMTKEALFCLADLPSEAAASSSQSPLRGKHWAEILSLWEIYFLQEMGFGLDLSRCALSTPKNACSSSDPLSYVSPKTGRAACAECGRPYEGKLLKLPAFIETFGQKRAADTKELAEGLSLSGHFMRMFLFSERPAPFFRRRLTAVLSEEAGVKGAGGGLKSLYAY